MFTFSSLCVFEYVYAYACMFHRPAHRYVLYSECIHITSCTYVIQQYFMFLAFTVSYHINIPHIHAPVASYVMLLCQHLGHQKLHLFKEC